MSVYHTQKSSEVYTVEMMGGGEGYCIIEHSQE